MIKKRNNVIPLRPTRPELLSYICKGWDFLELLAQASWGESTYYDDERKPRCACATGAGSYAAKVGVSTFEMWLCEADLDPVRVAQISDAAPDRDEAIRGLRAYFAWIDGYQARMCDLPATVCPYDHFGASAMEHAEWNRGFVQAIKEKADAARRRN